MQVKKEQLEPGVEQQTGSKLGKEYVKAVYCHPAYLSFFFSDIILINHVGMCGCHIGFTGDLNSQLST